MGRTGGCEGGKRGEHCARWGEGRQRQPRRAPAASRRDERRVRDGRGGVRPSLSPRRPSPARDPVTRELHMQPTSPGARAARLIGGEEEAAGQHHRLLSHTCASRRTRRSQCHRAWPPNGDRAGPGHRCVHGEGGGGTERRAEAYSREEGGSALREEEKRCLLCGEEGKPVFCVLPRTHRVQSPGRRVVGQQGERRDQTRLTKNRQRRGGRAWVERGRGGSRRTDQGAPLADPPLPHQNHQPKHRLPPTHSCSGGSGGQKN